MNSMSTSHSWSFLLQIHRLILWGWSDLSAIDEDIAVLVVHDGVDDVSFEEFHEAGVVKIPTFDIIKI